MIASENATNRGEQFYRVQNNTVLKSWQGLQDDYRTYCGVIGFSQR